MRYVLILLLVLGAGGYVAQRYHVIDFNKILEKIRPAQHPDVEIIDPSIGLVEKRPEPPKPVVTNVVEEPSEPPPPPPKTAAELKAEADEAQKALDQEIAQARAVSGKTLPSFAGIRFGDVMDGPTIALERLPSDNGTVDEGLCYRMPGPEMGKSFRMFSARPSVYVTPKTRQIFRIDFARSIARQPGWKLNAETTNLVATLSEKLKRKPFALDLEKYPLGDRRFVFLVGETTLTVGEYGGTQLRLTVEHGAYRTLAKNETAAFRTESAADPVKTKALSSDKYPNSGMVKLGRVRMKKGTPKAFCGLVFGSLPPYSAKVSAPSSSTDPKGFFIDYRKAKCDPFMNFDHGKALVSGINGAVTAVRLHSNGPEDGLTDAEFFGRIRKAIEQKYKVKPVRTVGEGEMPELAYEVGSLEIVLKPDPNGGFCLNGVNTTMQAAW